MGIKDSVPEPPSLEEVEVDLANVSLAPSDYDFSWSELPYGSGWDAIRIMRLCSRLVSIKIFVYILEPVLIQSQDMRMQSRKKGAMVYKTLFLTWQL